ncbi:MAG TPA: nucleoside deaminase [Pseudacidobacterium sp.]|jgi:tRNA(Arg) A34 adenosine deaminase TadA|nr:nucleoside deaminase [Pseudacidobacterium sp.]
MKAFIRMSNDLKEQFMRRAIALATGNVRSNAGGPFGAVIVQDGKIVGEGVNTVTATIDATAHAEVNAIRNACHNLNTFDLSGCELYTSCEPCPMCWTASYWAHIKAIYYGNRAEDAARINFADAFLYQQLALPREQRVIPEQEILRQEAWESFQAWADSLEKIEY